MSRTCKRLSTVALVVAMGATLSGFSMAQPAKKAAPNLAQAKAYFKNGVDLISDQKNPNFQDAYYQFKLAYKASGQSWKVLGNLGLCAMKLERDHEAIEHYSRYLSEGGDKIAPAERKQISRDLLLLKGNMANVNIEADAKPLTITDQRNGSAAAPQVYSSDNGKLKLGLRAGTHVVTATAGPKTLEWRVTIRPGEAKSHRFEFNGKKPKAPLPGKSNVAVTPTPEKKSSSPQKTIGYVSLGVGGAALVGGLITGLMAQSKQTSAQDQCRTGAQGEVCPERARSDYSSGSSLATTTNVLLIGGGVLAAAGAALVFTAPSEDPANAKEVRVAPMIGQQGVGLAAAGRF